MGNGSTIQSLDRGMRILELLAENQGMTASAIAEDLEIHQSSASRLLNSLVKAGLVYKPGFHLFALDYGVLVFAGKTMRGFPLVSKATTVCDDILHDRGYNAATAVLHGSHLIYLAVCVTGASIRLMDDDNFPVHLSSLGRGLACEHPREKAVAIFAESIANYGGGVDPDEIYNTAKRSFDENGIFYMENENNNVFNAAKTFKFGNRSAGLAIYSQTENVDVKEAKTLLDKSIKKITGES